jgi:hypothetical protein
VEKEKELPFSGIRISITCLASPNIPEFSHKVGSYLKPSDRLAKPKFDDHLTSIQLCETRFNVLRRDLTV